MLNQNDAQGFYVYILECTDHSFYTGWTTNPKQRYEAHKKGKGAKYTRAHPPLACVYLESCDDKISAMKREYEIKQYSHREKQALILAYQKQSKRNMINERLADWMVFT